MCAISNTIALGFDQRCMLLDVVAKRPQSASLEHNYIVVEWLAALLLGGLQFVVAINIGGYHMPMTLASMQNIYKIPSLVSPR